MDWIIATATCVAVLGGAVIVPRGQWKTAALAFWMLAVAFYLWFVLRPALSGQYSLAAFQNFGSAVTGGFMAYFVTPRWAMQRQSHYDQESIVGTAPRWIKKGWLAFSVLLCCGMVVFAVYQLYSAFGGSIQSMLATDSVITYRTMHIQLPFFGPSCSILLSRRCLQLSPQELCGKLDSIAASGANGREPLRWRMQFASQSRNVERKSVSTNLSGLVTQERQGAFPLSWPRQRLNFQPAVTTNQ